jgi:hypothetical protein
MLLYKSKAKENKKQKEVFIMKRTVAKELGNITVTDYKFERRFGSNLIVKLPFMRKVGDFCIYSTTYSDTHLYFQESGKCFKVEKATGRAVYTNKGSMPMDIYLAICPTYTFTVDMDFVNAVIEEISGKNKNKSYQEDGSIVLFG